MNERIRELLEQADMGYLFRKDKMFPGMVNPESLEKFAQLIVQECQRRVEQYINECGEVASMPDTVIMKHFGVRE